MACRRELVAWSLVASACFSTVPPIDERDPSTSTAMDAVTTMDTPQTSGSTSGDPSTGSSVDVSGSPDTGSAACPLDALCVAPVPDWEGPYLVARVPSPEAVVCPRTLSPSGILHAGLDDSPYDCGCECGPPANAPCNGEVHHAADGLCEGPMLVGALPPDTCHEVPATGSVVVTTFPGPGVHPCAASGPLPVPPPQWAEHAVLCAPPPDGAACDDGICVPPPSGPFDGVCIVRDGVHDCPDGNWSAPSPWYRDVDDTRGCGCACGPASAPDCSTLVDVFSDANCGTNEYAIADGDCIATPIEGTTFSVRWQPADPGSCTPQQSPMGSIVAVGETTVCCRA